MKKRNSCTWTIDCRIQPDCIELRITTYTLLPKTLRVQLLYCSVLGKKRLSAVAPFRLRVAANLPVPRVKSPQSYQGRLMDRAITMPPLLSPTGMDVCPRATVSLQMKADYCALCTYRVTPEGEITTRGSSSCAPRIA